MKQIENNFGKVAMRFSEKELKEIWSLLDEALCFHYQKYWNKLAKVRNNPKKVKELSKTFSEKSYKIKAIRDFFHIAEINCEMMSPNVNNELELD